MSKSKQKGTAWESAIVTYLRQRGFVHAERRALTGNHDRGDIAGVGAGSIVIEAKNVARHAWAAWLDEAEQEKTNAHANIGVVWAHRRGKASPADAYVLMTGRSLIRLLHEAGYGDE